MQRRKSLYASGLPPRNSFRAFFTKFANGRIPSNNFDWLRGLWVEFDERRGPALGDQGKVNVPRFCSGFLPPPVKNTERKRSVGE
jgi:hypothetical protein